MSGSQWVGLLLSKFSDVFEFFSDKLKHNGTSPHLAGPRTGVEAGKPAPPLSEWDPVRVRTNLCHTLNLKKTSFQ